MYKTKQDIWSTSRTDTSTSTSPSMPGLQVTALAEAVFIGACVEGFFCGIYSGIFATYLQYQISVKSVNKRPTIIFCSLCILYVLSVIIVSMDISQFVHYARSGSKIKMLYPTHMSSAMLSGCCDFIAQSILIYRCWIVWNRNIYVTIIPVIFTFTFLALWIVGVHSETFVYGTQSQGKVVTPDWAYRLALTSLAMTLAVNALVTALIVFKILSVYWQVKPLYSPSSAGSKLRPIIFIIIESGLVLLAIQLAYLLVVLVQTSGDIIASQIIIPSQRMLNGITPTIIQVRVSMGLSFHEEESMAEATSNLQFVNETQNSISDSEMGDIIRMDDQENGEENDIGMPKSNEIDHEESSRDDENGVVV